MPDLDNLTRCIIDSLYVWFCANGMALNPDKSEAILLGTRQQAHSYSSLATVNVAGSQIPLADNNNNNNNDRLTAFDPGQPG